MFKEVIIGVGGIVVGAVVGYAIHALVNYLKEQKKQGITPERAYFDEVNLYEIKQWFAEKMNVDEEIGILFYPTEENLKKWNMELEVDENVIIQMVYNQGTAEVVKYRKVAFGEMSEKLKDLLDSMGGTLVLEK